MADQHEQFPFLRVLEDNYRAIKEEVTTILYNEDVNQKAYFAPWYEKELYRGEWDVFGLYIHGEKWETHCEKCPRTTALVEQIPGLVTAGFSSMSVGTRIVPHHRQSNAVYQAHLGLIVPRKPKIQVDTVFPNRLNYCSLRVEDDLYTWKEGEAFVFDDTKEHEAWNIGDRTRIVLMLQFNRPQPGLPLESVDTSYYGKSTKGKLCGDSSNQCGPSQLALPCSMNCRDKQDES